MIHDHRIEQINQESEEFAALELVFKEFDLLVESMGEPLNIDMLEDFLQCLALARAVMNKFQIDPHYGEVELSHDEEINVMNIKRIEIF